MERARLRLLGGGAPWALTGTRGGPDPAGCLASGNEGHWPLAPAYALLASGTHRSEAQGPAPRAEWGLGLCVRPHPGPGSAWALEVPGWLLPQAPRSGPAARSQPLRPRNRGAETHGLASAAVCEYYCPPPRPIPTSPPPPPLAKLPRDQRIQR